MRWGYYFYGSEPVKLRAMAEHLVRGGYRIESIHKTDNGNEHCLHAERVETHTAQTLRLREEEFKRLAAEFGAECYDGWDVSPVPPN